MPANNVSLTASGDYAIQAAEIDRRRKYAEMLQQQALEPEQTQMAGGWAVRTPWTAQAAKLAKALVGASGQDAATQQQMALAQQMQGNRQKEVQQYLSLLNGTPEQTLGSNDPGDAPITTPAQPGNRQKAIAFLAGSQDPGLSQLGLAEMMRSPESNIAKVNPKDYTAVSIAKYMQSNNPADLVPVRNLHFQSVGDKVLGLDPVTGQQMAEPITINQSPDSAASLAWQQYTHQNPSAYQLGNLEQGRQGLQLRQQANNIAAGRLANEGARLYYDTGMGGAGAPRLNAMPSLGPTVTPGSQQPVPVTGQQPRPVTQRPQLPPGLTPKQASEIAAIGPRDQAEAAAKAQIGLPDAIAKAEQTIGLIDQMIGTQGRNLGPGEKPVAPHPGFQGVVGATMLPGARLIPGTDAAGFDALLDQVKGGAFMQAYETLKGAGQITEVEGAKATNAITRMSRSQSEAEFVKAAREFQDSIRAIVQRAKNRAQGNFNPSRVVDFNSL